MTLPAEEFIRRFLIHVLPDGFLEQLRADTAQCVSLTMLQGQAPSVCKT